MAESFQSRIFEIITGDREVALDITEHCATYLKEVAVERDGLLNVFVPHATAGVAVLETGAGSDDDLLAVLRDLLPPTTAGATATAAPATAATTSCPA